MPSDWPAEGMKGLLKSIAISLLVLAVIPSNGAAEPCSLKDLAVRKHSEYVIYGVTTDGIYFNFSNDDVTQSRLTPNSLLNKILDAKMQGKNSRRNIRLEVTYALSNWMLYRIVQVRSDAGERATDSAGVPHVSVFSLKPDERSEDAPGDWGTLFDVADTQQCRFLIKYSDKFGITAGFPSWRSLLKVKLKGRKMSMIETRLKEMERPKGYRYADESRLWNAVGDRVLHDTAGHMGKEWQYAFGTVEGRRACVSRGVLEMDIHLLWRHNIRLREAYRNMEMTVTPESEYSNLLDEKKLDDALFVGLRNGILFMCPWNESIENLDEMYTFAGIYAKSNPEITSSKDGSRGWMKVFVVSQSFKEVIVVIANRTNVLFRAFKTHRDRLRAYTLRSSAFTNIADISKVTQGAVLRQVFFFDNRLLLYYDENVLGVKLSGSNALTVQRMQFKNLRCPDTLTGSVVSIVEENREQMFNRDVRLQLMDGNMLQTTRDGVSWTDSDNSIPEKMLSTARYDGFLALKEQRTMKTDRAGFYLGFVKCNAFISLETNVKHISIDRISEVDCGRGRQLRVFYANEHLVVISRNTSTRLIHFTTRKVQFEDKRTMSFELKAEELENGTRNIDIIDGPSVDKCLVRGFEVLCMTRTRYVNDLECYFDFTVTNWLTLQAMPMLSMPINRLYAGDLMHPKPLNGTTTYRSLCKRELDNVVLFDDEDVVLHLRDTDEYLSLNERLADEEGVGHSYAPHHSDGERAQLLSLTFMRAVWYLRSSSTYVICEKNKKQIFMQDYGMYFLASGRRAKINYINKAADQWGGYTNAIEHIRLPEPEEIRIPKGREEPETKSDKQLWDLTCTAWQKTATYVNLAVIALETIALCAVILVVQLHIKPRIRKYRVQRGLAIRRGKLKTKKRALKRLKMLRLKSLRRKRMASRVKKHDSYSLDEESFTSSSKSATRRTRAQSTMETR